MKLYIIEGYVKENYVRKAVIAEDRDRATKAARLYGFEDIEMVSFMAETGETVERVL